jgi:hypothetical protein
MWVGSPLVVGVGAANAVGLTATIVNSQQSKTWTAMSRTCRRLFTLCFKDLRDRLCRFEENRWMQVEDTEFMGILPMKFATSFVLEKLRDDFIGQSGGFDPYQTGELQE